MLLGRSANQGPHLGAISDKEPISIALSKGGQQQYLAAAPRDVAVSRQEGPAASSRETLDVAPANIAQIPRATVWLGAHRAPRTVASDLRGALCYNHYSAAPWRFPAEGIRHLQEFQLRSSTMLLSDTENDVLGD